MHLSPPVIPVSLFLLGLLPVTVHLRYLDGLEAKEQKNTFCLSFCFEHVAKGRGPGLLEKQRSNSAEEV